MSTFKERLIEEESLLRVKIEALGEFMHTDKFFEIDPIQFKLLNIQIHSMRSYIQCLEERIKSLD